MTGGEAARSLTFFAGTGRRGGGARSATTTRRHVPAWVVIANATVDIFAALNGHSRPVYQSKDIILYLWRGLAVASAAVAVVQATCDRVCKCRPRRNAKGLRSGKDRSPLSPPKGRDCGCAGRH